VIRDSTSSRLPSSVIRKSYKTSSAVNDQNHKRNPSV